MEPDRDTLLRNIEETRTSLGEKLELLENQVMEKVESARSTVEGAIHSVSSTVHDTKDALKRNLNPVLQTREHPWLMVGGALAAGVVAGGWAGSRFGDSLSPNRGIPTGEIEASSEWLQAQSSGIGANRRPPSPRPFPGSPRA